MDRWFDGQLVRGLFLIAGRTLAVLMLAFLAFCDDRMRHAQEPLELFPDGVALRCFLTQKEVSNEKEKECQQEIAL